MVVIVIEKTKKHLLKQGIFLLPIPMTHTDTWVCDKKSWERNKAKPLKTIGKQHDGQQLVECREIKNLWANNENYYIYVYKILVILSVFAPFKFTLSRV